MAQALERRKSVDPGAERRAYVRYNFSRLSRQTLLGSRANVAMAQYARQPTYEQQNDESLDRLFNKVHSLVCFLAAQASAK